MLIGNEFGRRFSAGTFARLEEYACFIKKV